MEKLNKLLSEANIDHEFFIKQFSRGNTTWYEGCVEYKVNGITIFMAMCDDCDNVEIYDFSDGTGKCTPFFTPESAFELISNFNRQLKYLAII